MSELFDRQAFQRELRTEAVGRRIEYSESVDSTMRLAREAAERGEPHGSIFLAEQQTAGRGRQGRTFFSPPGENLYFTLLLRGAGVDLRSVALAVPLAVCRAIRAVGADALIKWPNDIWIGCLKTCGILIDAQGMGDQQLVMPGVGINVNTDFGSVPSLRDLATSLRSALGRGVDRELLLASICNELEGWLATRPQDVADQYRCHSLVLGERVWVVPRSGLDEYGGLAEGIESDGALRVRRDDRSVEVIRAAEVSLRPASQGSMVFPESP